MESMYLIYFFFNMALLLVLYTYIAFVVIKTTLHRGSQTIKQIISFKTCHDTAVNFRVNRIALLIGCLRLLQQLSVGIGKLIFIV